jgi:ABC-type dipeptide/oligopeptide/nickel transport system permease component
MGLSTYVVKRILLGAITVFGVLTILFFSIRMIPGDPAVIALGDMANPEDIARLHKEWGLDLPLHEQYIRFMSNVLLHGDFGRSITNDQPTMLRIMSRLPYTLTLAVLGTGLAILIGVVAGTIAAIKRNSVIDYLIMVFIILGFSVPVFYLGILFIQFFSIYLKWFPVLGPGPNYPFWENMRRFILPSLAVAIGIGAVTARMTRASILEVLHQDYIMVARAKGAPSSRVIFYHALKNALIPVVTIVGLNFGALLGGTVLIEYVFGIPGLGTLLVEAVFQRDYPQIQASVFVFSILFISVNILVDVLYHYLDPRIRLE